MLIYGIENGRALAYEGTIAFVNQTAMRFDFIKRFEQHKPTRSHWHWQRAGKSGTLEVTYEVLNHQLLVIVHENRAGADGWAKKEAPRFARALGRQVKGKVKKIASQRG